MLAKTNLILLLVIAVFFTACAPGNGSFEFTEEDDVFVLSTSNYRLRIEKNGFRYGFERPDGEVIVPPHTESGLQIGRQDEALSAVRQASLVERNDEGVVLEVETENGISARVQIQPGPDRVRLAVDPEQEGYYDIVGRTGGISPAYGLSDHAAYGRDRVELTGYENETFSAAHTRGGRIRLISNFVVFPRQGFAEINVEPRTKIIRVTEDENAQGSRGVEEMPALYYFIGPPKTLYREYLEVRNAHGYKVFKPKYEMFGVGWEAWGALAWDTREETVRKDVTRYLEEGYPLRWMIIGSGFWPRHDSTLHTTTSFGMWDENLYPEPKEMIDYFHERGLKVLIGLRIAFIPGGPFTEEGVERGYFLRENGEQKPFKIGFPRPPVYLLDTQNPEAVDWYLNLTQKWMDYGIDGFKEDLYGYRPDAIQRDDMIDPVNERMMERGILVMGRNGYLGSPADIHRYNDFNFNQSQDRGPINGLTLAYSGFPYVYPDIIGGTLAQSEYRADMANALSQNWAKQYMMRYARYASVNPSMSVGYGPWNFEDEQVNQVVLESARLHERLLPYIYDAALDAYETGFPYSMTPLPLAYPDDPGVYHLADTTRRSYQWMLGESLMAVPLYGDDYAVADSRDVYLPEGVWIDYDTGETYEGPVELKNYALPVEKTPLFIGGKGIVVEQQGEELQAFVYPVGKTVTMDFTHPSGQHSSIEVSQTFSAEDSVQVFADGIDTPVETHRNKGAVVFTLSPGKNYRVERVQ